MMIAYDNRIYSLAVSRKVRGQGIGTALVKQAERALRGLGCVKISLQILRGNEGVEAFYAKLGFETEQRVSMGKVIAAQIRRGEVGHL